MKQQYLGIEIDTSRDALFDDLGLRRLRDSYMREEETSPQQRYAFVSKTFSSNPAHAQRLYEYASKHWLSYSTPILSFGRSARGLPISCFLPLLHDSSAGLVDTLSEVNWLSMLGGGVGIHVKIRSADEKSVGVLPHLKTYDASCEAYRQGKTRRGSYAVYLDDNHPDITMFSEIRKPTGDPRLRCENLHNAVNISDAFMNKVKALTLDPNADDTWPLIDPASGKVTQVASVKDLWQRWLTIRGQTGEPYMHFIDTANRALPPHLKKQGLRIEGSNLCAEIELPTNKDRTAVCCLSSLNLEYYDEWKDDPLFIRDVAEMLDNVLTYFIEHAPDTIARARYSAMRERSIGIGVLGFHAYLQSKMIPFGCALSKSINKRIFTHIKKHADQANRDLAVERGECPDAVGYGLRFSHTMAIAPTASSSIIMGNTSPSIEPYRANSYRQDTLSGAFFTKNKFLDRIIRSRATSEEHVDEIWKSINGNDSSIQHLDFFTAEEKEVFLTAMEIDQRWIIELAGDRAPLIDQGQSINVFLKPTAPIKYLHEIHLMAWEKGIKALYYLRSEKIRTADKVSQSIERIRIEEEPAANEEHIQETKALQDDECFACGS